MADDAVERARGKFNSRGEPKLSAQVRQPVTWPTPQSHDAGAGNAARVGRFGTKHGGRNLNDEVKLWPTPRSTDGAHGGRVTPRKSREGGNLIEAVSHRRMWLTPSANEDAAGRTTGQMQQMLTHQAKASDPDGTAAGGQLNPDWVELLMGWPRGWTRLDPLDPAVFEAWREAFRSGDAVAAWQDGTWEEGVPRVAVKTPHRVPRLTGLGNGQVPLVVWMAWQVLS